MKNEIVRKLTSLTLMTIMFAGGLTFAIPGVVPEASAAHNANLFVSAENSFSSNLFAGPMVVEVVVVNSAISALDDNLGEPVVTVNGKKLRMLQANDGNWYAYMASKAQAQAADATQPGLVDGNDRSTRPGLGLNFGKFCAKDSATLGISFTDTEGIALPSNATFTKVANTAGGANGTDGTATFVTCSSGSNSAFINEEAKEMNVIRENKTLNGNAAGNVGGRAGNGEGIRDSNYWPFIQLFDFIPTGTAVIQYNPGTGMQTTTLTFDSMSGIQMSLDRTSYPQSAQVHLSLRDFQLNIDPTDEDSWSWGSNVRHTTGNKTVFYQLFNQTGGRDADKGTTFDYVAWQKAGGPTKITRGALGAQNLFGNLTTFMFEENGMLTLNNNTQNAASDVVRLADNADSVLFRDGNQGTLGLRTNTIAHNNLPITLTESAPNSGIFESTDDDNNSNLRIIDDARRGTTATVSYNQVSRSIVVANFFATINMDETAIGNEWNSGEKISVTLVDNDANLNARVDEDLDIFDANVKIWPAIKIGEPITLASLKDRGIAVVRHHSGAAQSTTYFTSGLGGSQSVDSFSEVARFGTSGFNIGPRDVLRFDLTTSGADFKKFMANGTKEGTSTLQNGLFQFLNYDLRSLETNGTNILAGAKLNFTISSSGGGTTQRISPPSGTSGGHSNIPGLLTTAFQGLVDITNGDPSKMPDTKQIVIDVNFTGFTGQRAIPPGNYTAVIDIFRFGTSNDGDDGTGVDRFNDVIYRLELEETGVNTSTFIGTAEYIMLNQLNINQTATYQSIRVIDDEVIIIVHEDLTDEDSVRVDYLDLGADGVATQIADQQAAPTHSGIVSFDFANYKIADTVTVTLTDQDLNVDSGLIDIFTVVGANDAATDQVGKSKYGQNSRGENFGRLLDITFDDETWKRSAGVCTTAPSGDDGLGSTGFTLVETGVATGIFRGDFQIPQNYCSSDGTIKSTTGKDMEVNYVDYRDASGQIIEVGDGAGIRANTGTVSLDRTVYPLPWGTIADNTATDGTTGAPTGKTPTTGTTTRSLFPVHATGIKGGVDIAAEILRVGDVVIHVQINDPDFNVSATGSDFIRQNATDGATDLKHGPVKIFVQRGTNIALLATAGGAVAQTGVITNGADPVTVRSDNNRHTRELGQIREVAPDAGIFEFDLAIRYTDGPKSTQCPTGTRQYTPLDGSGITSENRRFFALTAGGTPVDGQFPVNSTTSGRHCILQGDILTVEYRDPTDASGNVQTVTDSATFDLRNGVLQSDKSVYIIGSDMILTLIEPDFDRDAHIAETYSLDLIEWDSDAATCTLGPQATVGGCTQAAFDPEPSSVRETGKSTGIFQVVVEIPRSLAGDNLERGERIDLEYTDWGPSGADFVGQEDQDIQLIIFTSNFGATVELDQKVYTWTDKVYLTIIAPDHNFDSNLIDRIGTTPEDKLTVATRAASLANYILAETGTDTGIFTGEVILAGFIHDADGDGTNDITSSSTQTGGGPTDGLLSAEDNDGLTVSFEFSEDETVVGSALIRWNIGEVSWLEASYPASGTGVARVVDPDMNLNPESVDNFVVDVWSDSDAGGIRLTVTETNEATGIFEGTVSFTTTDQSSGHRLRVAEGDTITAEYEDNTLPTPYTRADELEITATAIIGTIVPPLERAPASNARVVDAFGNALTSVRVDQQVQIAAELSNGQDRDQKFAYLVQVQDANGVTVSLAWITGTLTAGQSFSPALSWIPDAPGTYTATVFVWESVDNPTALSPTVKTTINVS